MVVAPRDRTARGPPIKGHVVTSRPSLCCAAAPCCARPPGAVSTWGGGVGPAARGTPHPTLF